MQHSLRQPSLNPTLFPALILCGSVVVIRWLSFNRREAITPHPIRPHAKPHSTARSPNMRFATCYRLMLAIAVIGSGVEGWEQEMIDGDASGQASWFRMISQRPRWLSADYRHPEALLFLEMP